MQVRIGIDTGPVEAGVIGTAKFSYDLPAVQDDYRFQRRGPIPIRGMGEMVTYFLLGRNR